MSLVGGVEVDVGEHRVAFEGDLVHGGEAGGGGPTLIAKEQHLRVDSRPQRGAAQSELPSQGAAARYHLGEALSSSLLLSFS